MRGSVAICARLSTWKTPTVSARLQHARRPSGSSGGRCARSTSTPSCVADRSAIASSSAAIMPRPSRSTLTIPRSAQSSLSHCTTTRPGIDAGSSGTTSSSRPWRSPCRPSAGRGAAAGPGSAPTARRSGGRADRPGRGRRRAGCASSVSFGSRHSKWCSTLASRSTVGGVEAERLADLARRAPAAVGDDVGGHRRAARAVALGRRTGSPARAGRRSADRGRCRATRRAPRRGSARRAAPSPTGSTAVMPRRSRRRCWRPSRGPARGCRAARQKLTMSQTIRK